MSSVVYYKFKSQKEPSRVTFDGTGISVFDLKREILIANKLTANAESFDLQIINPDTKEEYKDDTEVIPRSISVTARRLPSAYPGASRYVNGTTGGGRRGGGGQRHTKPVIDTTANATPAIENAAVGSEEEKISAMFQSQDANWKQTQQHMSQQQRVQYRPTNNANANVPDHPPPSNYVCYRCGQKGHWIQLCPTNNDPNWEGKRVKRTTGIPKSMLKAVQRPLDASNGGDDAQSTYMVNEDGEYVIAVADNKSWQKFQDKTKAAQSQKTDERPTDPELECPLTHKLFDTPVKTPCCKKTYSKDAIENHLLEADFKCPNCGEEEVLLDQLVDDKDMQGRVDDYKKSLASENGAENQDSSEQNLKRKRDNDGGDDNDTNAKSDNSDGEASNDSKKPKTSTENDANDNDKTGSPKNQVPMPPVPPMPWMMPPPPMMMMMPPFMPPFVQQQNQGQNQNQNQGNGNGQSQNMNKN